VHSDKLAISAKQARGSEYVMEHDGGATFGDASRNVRRNLEPQAVDPPPDRASSQQVCLSLGPILLSACLYVYVM
jgi:hypothetical protein